MTVAALTPSIEYLENGVTLGFAAPFRFLDASHLEVKRIGADGTVSLLTRGSQWSASGGATDSGGTVTLVATVAGARLVIRRKTPREQSTDYVTADTFPAESHERALDRDMLIEQEQDVALGALSIRALQVPEGAVAPAFPLAAAGQFVGWNADGSALVPLAGTGADAGLRADLAGVAGADLVGFENDTLAGNIEKSAQALATRGKTRVRPMRILAGLDSLTVGTAASPAISYLDQVLGRSGLLSEERAVFAQLYVPGVSNLTGLTPLYDYYVPANSLPFNTYPRKYSLDGYGFHAAAAAGAGFSVLPIAPGAAGGNFLAWTKATIYYLKQPGGGTFDFRHGQAGSPGPSTPIDTDDAVISIGSTTIDFVPGKVQAYADVINGTGKLAIYAILFRCTPLLDDAGFAIKAAIPGSSVQSWASMDASIRAQWIDLLQIDDVILCGGMNDRFTRTNAQVTADMATLIAGFRGGATPPDITIVEPCQPSDHATNYWDTYNFKAMADAGKYSFFSLRKALGDYTRMSAEYGFTDGAAPFIHPSFKANMAAGTMLATARGGLAFNEVGLILGAGAGGGSPTAVVYDYDYMLPTWRVNAGAVTIPAGVASMIMEFGLAASYTQVSLEFEVTARVGSGVNYYQTKRLRSTFWTGATANTIAGQHDAAVEVLDAYVGGGWAAFDITVAAVIVAGKMQFQVTPSAGAWTANIFARIRSCTVIMAQPSGAVLTMTNHL